MTRDELKAQLRQYYDRQAELRQIQREIKRIEAIVDGPKGANLDGMPRSPGVGDPVLQTVIKRDELLRRLLERYRAQEVELAVAQMEIEVMIADLGSLERRLMRLRYIEGLTWEKISTAINYCVRQAQNIHDSALDQLLAMQEGENHGE